MFEWRISRLHTPLRVALLAALLIALAGCGDTGDTDSGNSVTRGDAMRVGQQAVTAALPNNLNALDVLEVEQQAAVREIIALYLEQAEIDFVTLRGLLQDLRSAVAALLDSPSEATLASAQEAWLTAHSAYETTLLHRYFAELVLSQQAYLDLVDLNFRMNSWPIFPGYLDAVENYPDSGLVHDPSVTLNRATLLDLHGQFDLAEAALGFHVLEFLLWGETPRLRLVDDYRAVTVLTADHIAAGLSLEQLPRNRRRQLLTLTIESLLTDFETTYEIWSSGMLGFQQRSTELSAAMLVSQLLTAVNGMLSEELLVRSLYPLLNGDYVDSLQSRFSNENQRAVVAYLSSVEQLLLDTSSSQGVRLDTLFGKLSEDFNELFYQNFDASKECLVLLYSTLEEPETPEEILAAEFEIVECINLLTSMIDHFGQIDQQLQGI